MQALPNVKGKMSIRIMSAVFESRSLGPTDRLVMLSLADHAGEDGTCYPSIARLCQRTGLSERAVQQSIKRLRDDGNLVAKVGGGRGNSTLYTITINPALETPFEKPRIRNTVSDDINPAFGALNPAADAPEPSRTIKEALRERGEAKASSQNARGLRLSPEWFLPVDWGEWALSEGMDRDAIRVEADRFRDYWIGVSGSKGCKADWQATWRNWIRRAMDGNKRGRSNGTTERRKFDAAINETARRLSAGTIHIDHSSRDPFHQR